MNFGQQTSLGAQKQQRLDEPIKAIRDPMIRESQ